MSFTLPKLPWAETALIPKISAETIRYHYGKHHAGYVEKLNQLVRGTSWETKSLVEIIRGAEGSLFNQAAQVWNHTFYWNSLSPSGGGPPFGEIQRRIISDFGSFEQFKKLFSDAAGGHFGSGWAWLYLDLTTNQLKVKNTLNAETPLQSVHNVPVLTCDVWEHAYYIDYRNARLKYIEAWWDLVNWEFANNQLSSL